MRIRTKEQKESDLVRLNAWIALHPDYAKKKIKEWKDKNRWRESVKRTERNKK